MRKGAGFRSGEPMDEKEAQRTWSSLREAIRQIHNHNASSLSFEELYRNAYSLVLHKYGEKLYEGVKGAVSEHLLDVLGRVTDATDDQLLSRLQDQWADHKTTMVMVRDILMYMDRNYVGQSKKMPVYDLGLTLFKDKVVSHSRIEGRLVKILLENVNAERAALQIDHLLMKKSTGMLVELGVGNRAVYQDVFESAFLAETANFYKQESGDFISKNTVSDFLRKAEQRIAEEKKRVDDYMHESTLEKVMRILDEQWITAHYKALVHEEKSGAKVLFQDDKLQDMKRMHQILGRVPETLEEVRGVMKKCIQDCGEEILKDPEQAEKPVNFIEALLQLKGKYDAFVEHAFSKDKEFQQCLKASFEGFINKDTRTAQYLSLYVDDLFKKSLKGVADNEIDGKLDQVVTVFRFLQDKDVFENFYKQHLSKRLLRQLSVSMDAEKQMIAKLKSECGHLYTNKMEGMFNDMANSESTMAEYKRSVADRLAGGRHVELKVNVLTSGYWPTTTPIPCELPQEVQMEVDRFQTFYLSKHTGRKVTWQYAMGSGDVKANLKKPYEINCSTFQMCVLALFNRQHSLSYRAIASATKVPSDELKRHLMSLYVSPKCRLLLRKAATEGSKELEDADTFEVNMSFESALRRVKVPLIAVTSAGLQANAGGEEGGATGAVPSSVEEDRKHLVEAAIVRVMKMRKTLEHNALVVEVTKHLAQRFQPTPLLIKQRIEKLIEREYLERNQQDRRVYNYLA